MSPIPRGGRATTAGVAFALAVSALNARRRRDTRRRRILIATAAAALLTALPRAQEPAPYRGGADVVSVYVTVTNRDGQLVADLTAADFEVTDNGRRQPIAIFSHEVQAITAVMMLDCSGSMAGNDDIVREGAGAFIDRLLATDRARIGNFAREIRLSPASFTSDRPILHEVLEHDLQESGPSPVWTAVDRSITALRSEAGRRVVLLFSDGYDQPDLGQIVTEVDDLVRRARYNEIMIYAIAFPYTSGLGYSYLDPDALFSRSRRVTTKKPHKALRALAADSGGGYFELTPHQPLGPVFARVADELHRQYWLGFHAPSLDGREHTIGVKVKRPNVTVRARKSYVASRTR